MIEDKQSLKKCVRQAVRHCSVYETEIDWQPERSYTPGEVFLKFIEAHPTICAGPMPLMAEKEMAIIVSMKAMGLWGLSIGELRDAIGSYSPDAWFRELLDRTGIQRGLVRIPAENILRIRLKDDRLVPMTVIRPSFFSAGKYGVEYHKEADRLRSVIRSAGIRHLTAEGVGAEALHYCILPVCEEEGCIVHLRIEEEKGLCDALQMLQKLPHLLAVLSVTPGLEYKTIEKVAGNERILLRLNGRENTDFALSRLGTRFIPFSAQASDFETILGSWILARERIWPSLTEKYTLMMRLDCTVSIESISKDVEMLLNGNLLKWEKEQGGNAL